jgi:hypothetical protein
MKTITFKTLSILLAAVLLVAALPVTAFADDVSICAAPECEHNYVEEESSTCLYVSNTYHRVTETLVKNCVWCESSITIRDNQYLALHEFDDSVDPEVDMEGVCTGCGRMIYW